MATGGVSLPSIIDYTGELRLLGNLPSPGHLVSAVPTWTAAGNDVMPESEWKEFDYTDLPVKIKDQDGKGACFPAGMRVRMRDGSERRIEDVRLLEHVVTAEGNISRVVRTMVRDVTDGLLAVHLWGHSHFRCTPNHEILTKRGYIAADSLSLDDWVAMPRYSLNRAESRGFILVADHLASRMMTQRSGKGRRHFNAPEGRKQIDVVLTPIPDVIERDQATGRIFGLFLAEGRTDVGKVTWTFNETEESTLVAELVRLLKTSWDVDAHIQHRPNHSINVVIYGTSWAKLFESLCANGSGSKQLHPDLTSGDRVFLESILDGWLAGDGHERRNGVQGVTISRDLALAMFDIAQALGRRPSIRRYQSPTYGTVKHRHARWEISTGAGGEDTYRCQMDDTHVWRRVKGIEREDFEGPVFNLEVEGDHSYVVEGIGVHNCNGHAAATSLELARNVAGKPHVSLSAWYIYAILCGGWDRGSNILDALALLSDQGTCPEPDMPYGEIHPTRITAAAKTSAARFKLEAGYSLKSWPEIMTAVQLLRPLNLSIQVGNAFNNLDSEGVPGASRGPGNHAVCVGFGAKKSAKHGWLIKMWNSWGTVWGLNGFCWLGQAHTDGVSYFEAYDVQTAADDPTDPTNPPHGS